jgi:feruloyl-CoA synthase
MIEGAERVLPDVELQIERRPDGSLVLGNAIALPPSSRTLIDRLRYWAERRPGCAFLTEPTGNGLYTVSYGEAVALVDGWGARLLAFELGPRRPLMIVASNSIDMALAMLGAMSVGIPAAIVSANYSLPSAAPFGRLATIYATLSPGFILSDAPGQTRAALAATQARVAPIADLHDRAWFADATTAPEPMIAAARASVTLDTVAKLLFTSGSTGSPKAVVNTHRMMVSNMLALSQVWPFLNHRPPVLVDWLPWNHTFGGNCCFNIALYFGGTLNIDVGKPTPGGIERTVEALKSLSPTVYFNVPAGYEALLPHLEADSDLARRFLGGLDFLFSAGAALPSPVRSRMDALCRAVLGRPVAIFGAWGSTETAPFCTAIYFDTDHAANLGVPIPGTEIKMVPTGDRFELRVRGPNVMPGYWGDPIATQAAFDEEGFYRIGDCGRLAESDRPQAGLLFDGRTSENFKLDSGTWVNVGALRLALIAAAKPFVSDAVIAGEGREDIGALIFANWAASRAAIGPECAHWDDETLAEAVASRIALLLRDHNAAQQGASTRVARFSVLTEPASMDEGEITEKGYLNQRAILRRRADAVDQLYLWGRRLADA